MSIVVVASIYPRPECRAEVIEIFEQTIAKVHADDQGCEVYALHEGDDRLVMIEKWASAGDLAVHSGGEALAALRTRLAGKLQGDLEVHRLHPHPAGTPGQGAL
jgi:quinol monooxygenase YgiN